MVTAGAISLLPGCQTEAPGGGGVEVSATAPAIASTNGLRARNGLPALVPLKASGLSTIPKSSSILNTSEGLVQLAYAARCALPANRSLTLSDANGIKHTFTGGIGFAPEWETSSCGQTCQEWVSACLLAMVNTAGVHVPIWLDAEHSAVGFGQSPSYPHQEGAFFGNVFLSSPSANFCAGRDFLVSPVTGRIGSEQDAPPYSDPYGTGGKCAGNCTPSDYPNAQDGFKACSGWNRVVTVWRQ